MALQGVHPPTRVLADRPGVAQHTSSASTVMDLSEALSISQERASCLLDPFSVGWTQHFYSSSCGGKECGVKQRLCPGRGVTTDGKECFSCFLLRPY